MTLNLDRYHANLPYPEVRRARPDKQLAFALMDGYSGEVSELTTVLQYAYHSLCCKRRFRQVSGVMRGIFYVETMHMEMLGDCVAKLGGDVRYSVALRDKSLYWQASLVNYAATPARMVLADIDGEKQAVAFYEEMAARCVQPDISRLLQRLAEDEKLHVRMLGDLYARHFRK